MGERDEVQLPGSFAAALRAEGARALQPPFEAIITVAVNATLMSTLWFLLPSNLKDDVFTLHQSLLFAVVLCGWMYADVPATNVLGSDAERILAAIDDPPMLRRLLDAKSVVLWIMVTPICLIVAIISGIESKDLLVTLYSTVWIGIVPLGVLGVSSFVGIRYPYHPMSLRTRRDHLKPRRRMLWRWIVLITIPYLVVPMLSALLMVPSLLIWGFAPSTGLSTQIPHSYLGLGVGIACVLAAGSSVGGRRLGCAMIRRRRAELVAFLSDPIAG
jgi:hypothetical protein